MNLDGSPTAPGGSGWSRGAHDPSESVVYIKKAQVSEAYHEDLGFMFREFEDGVAVGSHDPEMLTLATDLHARYGTPTRSGC